MHFKGNRNIAQTENRLIYIGNVTDLSQKTISFQELLFKMVA